MEKCNHNIDTCPVHSGQERTLVVVLACLAKQVIIKDRRR